MNRYKIDIIPGYGCNFRCKYCFEQEKDFAYKNISMTDETISNVSKYINFLLSEKLQDAEELVLCFYGGEPLLYLDIIEKIINNFINDKRVNFNIITNGSLIKENINKLIDIQNNIEDRLNIRVSYDYYLQDNRKENTYDLVRNNILLLNKNNINVKTLTVLTPKDFENIDNIFNDFYNLYKKNNSLKLRFNIATSYRYDIDGDINNVDIDVDKIIKNFKKIKYKYKNICEINKMFKYNNSYSIRNFRKNNCLYSDIYTGIDVDGSIFPSYSSCYSSDIVRENFYMGSVNEDFNLSEQKRDELFNKLKLDCPEKCKACNAYCTVIPWDTIVNSLDEYNGMPTKEHCEIHKLITECLND